MIIYDDEQNSPEWFKHREGKITSSRVKDVIVDKLANKTDIINYLLDIEATKLTGTPKENNDYLKGYKKELSALDQIDLEKLYPLIEDNYHLLQKKEYFRLLAEKLGYKDDEGEDPRERGHRLEPEAIKAFEDQTKLTVKTFGFCTREDYTDIGLSPDGIVVTEFDNDIQLLAGVEVKSLDCANHLEVALTKKVPKTYFDQIIQYFVVSDVESVFFLSYNPNVKIKQLVILEIFRKDVEREIEYSFRRQVDIIKHLDADILALSF